MPKRACQQHIAYSDGINGKVLDKISITNATECRYISIQFQDNTEVMISLDLRMRGKLSLTDWKTGNEELICELGRIPDEQDLD